MDLESVPLLGLVLAVATAFGSAFGFRAAFQIGALSRRLAMLEAQLVDARSIAAVPMSPAPGPPVPPVAPPPPVERPRDRALRDEIVHAHAAATPSKAVDTRTADWWRALELRAGTRWITWVGAAALLIGAALLLKLAIDEGWLGPVARLGLGAAAGLALIAGGHVAQRAEMRPLSQGLSGVGLGVLYVVTFVAFSTHGLIARELAFAAMIGITIAGGALALRHDAQAVAILALLGGLITPVALSSGAGGRDVLCLYLLVLDLGALVIALVRGWRAVELVAIAGTWMLFGGYLEAHHTPESWRGELGWLAVFHVAFLAVPYALRRWCGEERELVAGERFFVATAGAVIVFVMAAVIVEGAQVRLGAVTLVMAAGYAVVASVAARAGVHRGFMLIAVALVTLAVPLVLAGSAITIAWAIEAPVLVLLGVHWRQTVIRYVALGVLGLAALQVASQYLEREVATAFVNVEYAAALVVALAGLAFAVVDRRARPEQRWLGTLAALGGAAVMLAGTHAELASRSLHLRPLLWAIAAGAALVIGSRRSDRWALVTATGFAATAGLLVLDAYGRDTSQLARLGTAVLTLAAVGGLAMALRRFGDVRGSRVAWIVTLSGLGLVIGAEAGAHHHALLSSAWAGYAATLLAAGFVRRQRALRLAGLGLFGLVAAKLVLIDLAGAPPPHRVMSFLLVGALMIAASLAYHRLERR